MKPAVAATAWGNSLACPTFNDQVFDAIRAFRSHHADKGPEFIPSTAPGPQGVPCRPQRTAA